MGLAGEAPMSDERWWALARHYGAPSPLIDWTRSPYVAAFFAYRDVVLASGRGRHADGKIAIWGLNVWRVREVDESEKLKIRIKSIYEVDHQNARLISQQGLFVVSDPMIDLDALFEKYCDDLSFDGDALIFVTLPAKEAYDALCHLHRMNINHATLFPDIEGACTHAKFSSFIPDMEGIASSDGQMFDWGDES